MTDQKIAMTLKLIGDLIRIAMVSLQWQATMVILRRSKQMAQKMNTLQMASGTSSMLKATLFNRTPNNPTSVPMSTLLASWLSSSTTTLTTSQKHSRSVCSPHQSQRWTISSMSTSTMTTRWVMNRLSRTSRRTATITTSLTRIANKWFPISW